MAFWLSARSATRGALSLLILAALCGCAAVFDRGAAQEVSRDRLLRLADDGAGDHLEYRGSDRGYHYVYDRRKEHAATYKVRADQMPLPDTFDVGEGAYPLHHHLIEGRRLGARPDYAN